MSIDFGPIRVLGADAVGAPGQRRFRIFAQNSYDSAVMWVEKEQLRELSLLLDRFVAHLSEGQILRTEASASGLPRPEQIPADFPTQPTYDFRVGEMKLSYDERSNMILLNAVPGEIVMERGGEPQLMIREEDAVSLLMTQQQAQQLASSITAIVTSGRPVCPLCNTPLDGGPHACVKQNGHRQVITAQEQEEDGE